MTRRGALILSVLIGAFVLVVTGGVAGRLLSPDRAPTAVTQLEPAADPDSGQPVQAEPPAMEDAPAAYAAHFDDEEHEAHERHHWHGRHARHFEQREDD